MKPWPSTGPARRVFPSSPPAAAALESATALPSPGPTGGGPGTGLIAVPGARPLDCLSASTWLLVTDELLGGRAVRAWMVTAPHAAAGPGDPAIPEVRVTADRVLGLGVCAPVATTGMPAWNITVWRVGPGTTATIAARLAIPAGVRGGLLSPATPAGSPVSPGLRGSPSAPPGRTPASTPASPAASVAPTAVAPAEPTDSGPVTPPPTVPRAGWSTGAYVLELEVGAAVLWLAVDLVTRA